MTGCCKINQLGQYYNSTYPQIIKYCWSVLQMRIDSIYIVLRHLKIFCCIKTTNFHVFYKLETFYNTEFLHRTFQVSLWWFPWRFSSCKTHCGSWIRFNFLLFKLDYLFFRRFYLTCWIFSRIITVFIHLYGWYRVWNFYGENWYSTLKLFYAENQYI